MPWKIPIFAGENFHTEYLMKLSDLKSGESAVIIKVLGHGAFRKRVMEMGFVRGRSITAILAAPLKDPVKYRLMGYEVSLRRSEASMIEVLPETEFDAGTVSATGGRIAESGEEHAERYEERSRVVNVALIGNPNCGKTSLFNIASGAQEHVGNYSGVTVGAKTGVYRHAGYTFNIIDLSGTYSLSAYSPEERYVRRYLRDNDSDVIVNVIDGSNLERNLYLTTELIDMDHPMVIALNMFDEMRAAGTKFDHEELGRMIGVPIVPTVSRTGEGIPSLFDTIVEVYERRNPVVRHVHVKLSKDIEDALSVVKDAIKADNSVNPHYSPRYLAIKLLEGDKEAEEAVGGALSSSEIMDLRDKALSRLERQHPEEDVSSMIAGEKYGFIAGALAETLQKKASEKADATHIIDALVTSRLFGFPIFLLAMFLVFWATFSLGSYPQEWIELAVDWVASVVNANMPDGPLKDMLCNGVIGGVGGVIVFLPNILILFFFISFMEDSGYMARAAFIMDKLMHKIGLHGKSFIPLIMGFGCNVPAVMAARAIESRSSKAITVLILPFMSCSARLPIYVLLVGTFFKSYAAFVFLGIYVLGIVVAALTARILRRFYFKKDETPFVMELPPYRVPTMKTTLRHMWGKGKEYLKKMGGIILLASIVVWALDYFPLHDEMSQDGIAAIEVADSEALNPDTDSYLEMMGKVINPVLEPLGFSWRATVAAIAGIPAKEIVVSTMGVLYTGSDDVDDHSLAKRISTPVAGSVEPDFTPANALSFMIFVLLYCPCVATIVAVVKETRSVAYGLFSIFYNTAVAWLLAFVAYRLMLLL